MKFKLLIPLTFISLLFYSCDKDEPEVINTLITLEAQTFEALETITDADEIGRVVASSNMTEPLSYRIAVNSDNLFSISNDGVVGLATGRRINFKTSASHQITVEATDGKETATATITINVIDVPDPFIATWKTDESGPSDDNQIRINTVDGLSYDYTIDWGDGTEDTNVTGPITHTYATAGTYTVSILGTFPGIFNSHETDAFKLLSVEQWGDVEWQTMESAFVRCRNLNINATDAPDLTQVNSMYWMFAGAHSMNADFNNWDVSNVTNMEQMFGAAESFNGDISSWDVSNVTNMIDMFYEAESFNGDISDWDVSNVTNMEQMFRGTLVFNQDLNNWDVSNVTIMKNMFQDTPAFNGDISAWDVSSVTDMTSMFFGSNFNGDISNWNVSNVTNMSSMFRDASFNGDVSNWDVSSVTNMDRMFWDAIFAGDISSWDVSQVTNMSRMIEDSGITPSNYNALLMGWSARSLQSNVSFGAGNLTYGASAQPGRDVLTNTYNWTITDGGVR